MHPFAHSAQNSSLVASSTKSVSVRFPSGFFATLLSPGWMTSLYFEAEDEDDLRKIGFSKDGKFQNPQIMLGLLVGKNGYHRLRRRIEAHVLVAFVAYTIYKELERRLADAGIAMSPKRAAELTQTMYEISFKLPNAPDEHRKLLEMDADQQQIYNLLY